MPRRGWQASLPVTAPNHAWLSWAAWAASQPLKLRSPQNAREAASKQPSQWAAAAAICPANQSSPERLRGTATPDNNNNPVQPCACTPAPRQRRSTADARHRKQQEERGNGWQCPRQLVFIWSGVGTLPAFADGCRRVVEPVSQRLCIKTILVGERIGATNVRTAFGNPVGPLKRTLPRPYRHAPAKGLIIGAAPTVFSRGIPGVSIK